MSQSSHPTFINLPQPPSQPDTPSEMPGTPTSTTTSLSALSTTAIKDGHRGHTHHSAPHHRGHQHNLSTTSLEAERADRISRLTGLSGVSALRGTAPAFSPQQHQQQSPHSRTTPTSTGFIHPALSPAYFDAAGQPVAATKMSTVGSASATESVAGRTSITETGDGSGGGRGGRYDDDDDDDGTTHRRDRDDDDDDDDDVYGDERSMDTNERDTEVEMDSASGYMVGRDEDQDRDGDAVMDDDNEMLATRSMGGFEDRMSDDGSASLVGFGEGAGSTVSGPIYHRRPLPGGQSSASAMMLNAGGVPWGLERSASGLSSEGPGPRRGDASALRALERESSGLSGLSGLSAENQSALQERREALMVDGVTHDGAGASVSASADDDVFVDTSTRGPVPLVQHNVSAIRETQQPHSHQAQAQARHLGSSSFSSSSPGMPTAASSRGRAAAGGAALGSPKGDQALGKFYFEERK